MVENLSVSIVYCGHQVDYLYGMLTGFSSHKEYKITVIDAFRKNNKIEGAFSQNIQILPFLNKDHNNSVLSLIKSWTHYYIKLFSYILTTESRVFHIEWINRKLDTFEHLFITMFLILNKKKIVFKVHDLDTNILLDASGNYKRKISITKRFFFNNVDAFIVHNNYVRDLLISLGYSSEKIYRIPHGINNYQKQTGISKSDARRKFNIPLNATVLLFYGNIRKYKGLEELLKSFKTLSEDLDNVYLLIGGNLDVDKNYEEDLYKFIGLINKKLVITHFRFIKEEETEYFFKASDVLCLPYKFIYQSGLPFLSYAMGIPVIVSNVGGISEDVENYKTGVYYDDNEGLTETLRNFINGEYKLLNGKQLSEYCKNKYNWIDITKKTIDCYEQIYKTKV